MKTQKRQINRRTGYYVWAHGYRTWHRTLSGAEKKALSESRWASDVQIVDVATGERV
jgi:hypothetical protein